MGNAILLYFEKPFKQAAIIFLLHRHFNTTIKLVDTRFKLLCDELTLESQIRQNISLKYRRDSIFRFVSVSGHSILHVVSNTTHGVTIA